MEPPAPVRAAPVDAGVFTVDAKGAVRFRFQPKTPVRSADKFAVTVEKKGGVPAPQGTMVLAGSRLCMDEPGKGEDWTGQNFITSDASAPPPASYHHR